MASEIRVNKIENRSGLGTVTFADTGVDLAGIVTATTFSGSGASLTNVPDSALSAVTASKLTGALPAISGANLTGIAATDNVRTGILDVAGIATFRNDVNIGTAVTISESGIEASGIGITCVNINGTQIGGRTNLIINGAMTIAQRATSYTGGGYETVDRFFVDLAGLDENPTQAQVDVSSGTTPYTLGFRKAYKITNGNQTSGAGAGDVLYIKQKIESQNISNSGWNYTSASSFVTLQFWIKSSVAQTFTCHLSTEDGTSYIYNFETGSLTANTWTKIVKTIPGNSNLQIDNDNGNGLAVVVNAFAGTNFTDSSTTYDTWTTYSTGIFGGKDNTSTWFTTNDATLEMTGFQLEVGSQATPFEHRNYDEELRLCQRYYQYVPTGLFNIRGSTSISYSNAPLQTTFLLPIPMRASPTASNKADGGSTITMTYYSASYGSATNYEASLGIGFDNAIVRFNFVHSASNNSGTALGTTYYWGETVDSVAFASEL